VHACLCGTPCSECARRVGAWSLPPAFDTTSARTRSNSWRFGRTPVHVPGSSSPQLAVQNDDDTAAAQRAVPHMSSLVSVRLCATLPRPSANYSMIARPIPQNQVICIQNLAPHQQSREKTVFPLGASSPDRLAVESTIGTSKLSHIS
jgi:hypothetical protein